MKAVFSIMAMMLFFGAGIAAGQESGDKDLKPDAKTELEQARKKIKELEAEKNAEIAKRILVEKYLADIKKKQEDFHKKVMVRINETAGEVMKEVQNRSDEFLNLAESVRQLNKELVDKQQEFENFKEDQEKVVRKMVTKIKALETEQKELLASGVGPDGKQPASRFFPLVLDISTGKPLWDNPVGKITRVNLKSRQVTINLGSAQGVKPALTFTVYGAGSSGRAAKQMKGTIEVVRVIDANTSLARVTSLYDVDGQETAPENLANNKILSAGDLLFNMFWGTRVAIAGYASITGDPSDDPAEQVRQMDDLKRMLQSKGIQVDAHVDLRNGKILGKITSKTRYLILGEDVMDQKEEESPKKQAGSDRAKLIRDANELLRQTAGRQGMLMISAENFATLIGHRRAHAPNNPER